MPHPIGIDLGTTYSCVAVLRDGQVEVLPNDNGNKVTPSVVGFDENGSDTNIVVGEGAVDQQSLNPSNTVYEIKRLIGKEFKDAEVQKDISRWPFKVKCDNDIDPKIQVRYRKEEKLFLPQQVSGMVIKSMRAIAEKALGEEVTEAVITVPAYFNDAQRQATVAAGEIAGLKVLQILNEPTAAAIAYGCQNTVAEPKTYLIYDLGGGTFDVSILKIQKGKFDVLAVNGDCHLGGADFDTALVENVALQIKSKHGVDILKDEKIVAKLRRSCEIAKRRLTANSVASVRVDDIGNGESFEAAITRTRFNELCDRHFQNTLKIVQKALDDAKLQPRNIDGLVLIGGSTRIVKIRELIAAKFPSVSIIQNINPDEAVAYGAAILASKLSQNCEDIVDGVVLDDIEVNDVVPLSLGVQLVGDAMSVLIPRNTRIPYSYTKTYRNAMDSESLDVVIYQGEDKRASNNFLLGEYKLRYPAAKRREIQLKQTFAIDANGIFNVSTKIATTGEVVSKTIDYRQAKLSEDEIAKLVADTAMIEVYDGEAQRCSKLRSTFEAEVYALKSAAEEKKLSSSNAFNNSAKEMCLTFIDWIDSNRDAAYINIDAKYQQFLKRAEEYDACLKFTRLALGK